MNRLRFFFAVLFTFSLCSSALPQSRDLTARFDENTFRAHIKFLSDDLLEGRSPGTRGGNIAANYLAAQLQVVGVKGGGANGSFFQPVALVGVKAASDTALTISGTNGSPQSYKFADEFVAFTGAQTENVKLDAPLVFVGYGINAPEQKWNDYKGAETDYRGKILVIMVNDPPATAAEPNLFGGKALTYYGRWTYKFEEAARRGAAGALLIHTTESAGYGWNVVRTSNANWRYDIARTPEDKTPFLGMRSWMTEDTARKVFAQSGRDLDALRKSANSRDFKPVDLGLKANIEIKSDLRRVDSANVVGVLEGSDAKLKDEYVVYSAHYDHLGVGENDKADNIYNGAVDNASGCASVLAIAAVLAKMPLSERPKRSSLFLFPTAEEQGLLGADWYSKHPLVPTAKTAANVNLDSMNYLGKTTDFAALGVERSTLQPLVEAVARERNLKLVPDTKPEQGSFYRSDHFPFARVGVPSLSMENGESFVGKPEGWGKQQFEIYNSQNYHQPSDQYSDSWDFAGMIQMSEISLAIGIKAGNIDKLPAYNPTDEFAKAQPNRK